MHRGVSAEDVENAVNAGAFIWPHLRFFTVGMHVLSPTM
jgi:hypothetical protein